MLVLSFVEDNNAAGQAVCAETSPHHHMLGQQQQLHLALSVAAQTWPLHGKQSQRLRKHKPLALSHRRRARSSMVAVSVVLESALEAFPLEAVEASPAMALPPAKAAS